MKMDPIMSKSIDINVVAHDIEDLAKACGKTGMLKMSSDLFSFAGQLRKIAKAVREARSNEMGDRPRTKDVISKAADAGLPFDVEAKDETNVVPITQVS